MTQEQKENLTKLALDYRKQAGEAARLGYPTMESRLNGHADALEALLAEREELIKDKARLDWLESRSCGFHHIKWGEYHHYSYPENEHGLKRARATIDAAMKGEA